MTLATIQPSGVVRPIQGQGAPALPPGDLAELIAAFNDVTSRLQTTHESLRGEVARLEAELREAKDQLRRSKQLAELGEMAAGIAHEVRNPLGSIRLYASALVQDLQDRDPERSLAEKIAGAVTRLDAVVGEVLAFARPMNTRMEEITTGALIDGALDSCADLLSRYAISVHAPAEAERRHSFVGDAAQIHQAMTNVVRNAVEAMGESGSEAARHIWFDASRRRVLNPEGSPILMVAISVRDSGPGVRPEALPRVFNPFYTTRHTGTGLGLAIVHRIVDAHGGRVVIRNNTDEQDGRPARGATVEFLLPAAGSAGAIRGGAPGRPITTESEGSQKQEAA